MLVTIKNFASAPEAYVARSKLASENIPAIITDEHMSNMLNVFGGVRLQVPEAFAERASKILAEDNSDLLQTED